MAWDNVHCLSKLRHRQTPSRNKQSTPRPYDILVAPALAGVEYSARMKRLDCYAFGKIWRISSLRQKQKRSLKKIKNDVMQLTLQPDNHRKDRAFLLIGQI